MRSKKLLKNTIWSVVGYVAYALAGFISRSIFVSTLGNTVAGIATLFSSVLSLFSLAELGFGNAIVLHLYKPVAEGDHKKIAALINLYGKVYRMAAAFVLTLGVVLLPFVQYLAKTTENIENLQLYFFLYTLKSAVSYLYSYKSVVINVHQESYLTTNITNLFLILMTVTQTMALYYTGNFVLYLIIPIVGTLACNVTIYCKAGRMYPYLATYKTEKVDRAELKEILQFIKAAAIDRVSGIVKQSTDDLIVSAFVGVVMTGIVGNYTMVIGAATTILSFFFNNATPAVGNLIASESKEHQYNTLLDFQFVTFWLYGFIATGLLCTLSPFVVDVWMRNPSLELPQTTLYLLVVNFYLLGIALPMTIYFTVSGYIKKAPFINLVNVLVNLVVSMALVGPLGTNGVYVGTIVSLLTTSFWFMPYFVCKHRFEGNHKDFWLFFLRGMLVVALAAAACVFVCGVISGTGLLGFVWKVLACTVVFNAIYALCFARSVQMRSMIALAKALFHLR